MKKRKRNESKRQLNPNCCDVIAVLFTLMECSWCRHLRRSEEPRGTVHQFFNSHPAMASMRQLIESSVI
ncbi:hypothetical protein AMELA_G00098750 [Ameiurus melas]|uniref:Uncharacterized protein n=1 Tax=Ameiurus melas TaxID=219545 RepID=A0A7J6AT23_AMEME|nr:hypothetical protein AMELA_G00098750 [Ameiurus melas]